MRILYVSSLVSNNYFNLLFDVSKHKPGQQVQRFHRLILEGLITNKVIVDTISIPPISKQITNRFFYKSQKEIQAGINFNHLKVVNIFLLKHVFYFVESVIISFRKFKKHKNIYLVCDVLNISAVAGVLLISKMFNIKSTGIVTDLPSHLVSNKKFNHRVNEFLISSFDSYIFLTEHMNKLINCKQKPYLIMEGLVDVKLQNKENVFSDKNSEITIMYAGGLERRYGIEYLVKGFIKASIPNSRLELYGSGDYAIELKRISEEYQNIYFYGVVKNEEVIEKEIKAHLLVNPRFTNMGYTKYSFPSKNLEYMSVGTPLLTTPLEGMPKEYFNFVYLINEETVDGLSNALKHIFNKPLKTLHEKGFYAKMFVLNNKNNNQQAKRIIELLEAL